LTESHRNAVKDDDRADLLWQPENLTNSSDRQGNCIVLLSEIFGSAFLISQWTIPNTDLTCHQSLWSYKQTKFDYYYYYCHCYYDVCNSS